MSQTGYKRFLNRRKWQTDFTAEWSPTYSATPDTKLTGTHSFRFSVNLLSNAKINLFLDTPGALISPTISWTFSYDSAGSEQTYDVTLASIPDGDYNFRLLVVGTSSIEYNARYLAGSFEPNSPVAGDGPYFNPVWDPGVCPVNGTQQLAAPTLNLSDSSLTSIAVQWGQVLSSTGYLLQKSLNGASWSTVLNADPNTFAYFDTDYLPQTMYWYRVMAIGNGVNYTDSTFRQADITTGLKQLASPILAVGSVTNNSISLTWADVSNESYYVVERSFDFAGPYAITATPSAGSTSYLDSGLVTNTRYYYRVQAIGTAGYTHSEYRLINARTT